jgi:hypothetical protein
MPASAPNRPEPNAQRPAARARRTLLNAVALAILYGNVAVALQPRAVRSMGLRVPRAGFVVDAFLITGMFSSYSLVNTDLFIAGRRTQSGLIEDRGQWIYLHVREHFPQRYGVRFVELFAAHHWDMHGKQAQRRAWGFLARRIREHHNRIHPGRAVSSVRFGTVQWPIDPRGYRAGKQPGQTRTQLWFSEPEPPAQRDPG